MRRGAIGQGNNLADGQGETGVFQYLSDDPGYTLLVAISQSLVVRIE